MATGNQMMRVTDRTPAPVWSEPTLVGEHNAHLDTSTLRILKGGSWKKQDTVILIPAAKMVPFVASLSWAHLMKPPNQSCPQPDLRGLMGMEVGEAYSKGIEGVLEHPQLKDHKYILTIEHDNCPPQDGLLKLLSRMEEHPEFACIGGLYWTKGPMGVPQIWGDAKDPLLNFRPQPPDPRGGMVECCGTGMGFNLWRISMFKDTRLRRPWFKTVASAAEGIGTQDLYFWNDARKFGYRCAIDCDVKVGHYSLEDDKVW